MPSAGAVAGEAAEGDDEAGAGTGALGGGAAGAALGAVVAGPPGAVVGAAVGSAAGAGAGDQAEEEAEEIDRRGLHAPLTHGAGRRPAADTATATVGPLRRPTVSVSRGGSR